MGQEKRRKLLDGRLKTENYMDDLEENLEENLEEESGQNIRLEKKEIERKMLEELEDIAEKEVGKIQRMKTKKTDERTL